MTKWHRIKCRRTTDITATTTSATVTESFQSVSADVQWFVLAEVTLSALNAMEADVDILLTGAGQQPFSTDLHRDRKKTAQLNMSK